MRNRLAHHLDYSQIEAQVRTFLSLCEEPEDPEEPDDLQAVPLVRRLRWAVVFVCHAFEGISQAHDVIRDLRDPLSVGLGPSLEKASRGIRKRSRKMVIFSRAQAEKSSPR